MGKKVTSKGRIQSATQKRINKAYQPYAAENPLGLYQDSEAVLQTVNRQRGIPQSQPRRNIKGSYQEIELMDKIEFLKNELNDQ